MAAAQQLNLSMHLGECSSVMKGPQVVMGLELMIGLIA